MEFWHEAIKTWTAILQIGGEREAADLRNERAQLLSGIGLSLVGDMPLFFDEKQTDGVCEKQQAGENAYNGVHNVTASQPFFGGGFGV